MGKVHKWLYGYFPRVHVHRNLRLPYYNLYLCLHNGGSVKWLHYNYMVASYYSLCHVTCTYNLKLDKVKVTEEQALFLFS